MIGLHSFFRDADNNAPVSEDRGPLLIVEKNVVRAQHLRAILEDHGFDAIVTAQEDDEGAQLDEDSFGLVLGEISRPVGSSFLAGLVQTVIQGQRRERKRSIEAESLRNLASISAHNLTNLLTLVNGLSDYLLCQSQPSNSLLDIVQQIRQASSKAAVLVRKLAALGHDSAISAD